MELIERVAEALRAVPLYQDDYETLAKAAIRAMLDGVELVVSFYVDDYGLAYRKDDGEPWKPMDYTNLYSLDALKEAL